MLSTVGINSMFKLEGFEIGDKVISAHSPYFDYGEKIGTIVFYHKTACRKWYVDFESLTPKLATQKQVKDITFNYGAAAYFHSREMKLVKPANPLVSYLMSL